MTAQSSLTDVTQTEPTEELDVEVRLDLDHHGPDLFAETVAAGTWATGWI